MSAFPTPLRFGWKMAVAGRTAHFHWKEDYHDKGGASEKDPKGHCQGMGG
jgi:hypothetical protein